MKTTRIRDIAAAAALFVLGLVMFFVVIPNGVTVPGSVQVAALSPDFWPRLIALASVAASAFLLIEALAMEQPVDEEEDAAEAAKYQLATLPAALRVVVLVVGLFGFYASLTTLGVVAASIILICAMMLFFGERKYVLIGALSVGVPILLYVFFRYVASVPIPLGMFG